MTLPYQFFPKLFLRTPLWSFADYQAGSIDGPLKDPRFRLALYLASPGFYRVLEAKNFDAGQMNEKELQSLEKYYNRMSFRPTPFGLFSSFTLAEWGEDGPIVLGNAANAILHLRADQRVATAVADKNGAGPYHLNPTLYRAGREFRFIKTVAGENSTRLSFSLESFDVNPLTRALCKHLKADAKSGEQIIAFIISKTGCDNETAAGYLEFLKGAQVIRSGEAMSITGLDYMERMGVKEFTDLSGSVGQVSPIAMDKLEKRFSALLNKDNRPVNYFYANTERKAVQGSLSDQHQAKLAIALGALAKLALPADPGLLAQFAADFAKRFEGRKIPLLQALDPDMGVGYGSFAEQAATPALLKDLPFPVEKDNVRQIPWSPVHRLLLEKWRAAASDQVIRLESKDLEVLQEPEVHLLPPSIAVMFRTTEEGLFVENAGGANGTSLIGRFTPFSEEIHRFAREISGAESAANPGIVFAEISQLSDRYTDNVNRRLHVYDHEIPINSVSLLPDGQQIGPGDLLVSVNGGAVVLESRRLKKMVVPRLSSAYNFRHNNLALFRFLCDLQYQSLQANLTFDLENYFPGMSNYPRVEFEGIILAAAKWHVRKEGLEKPQWPSRIALTRSDQQLVFNLDDEQQASLFAGCIRGADKFTVQEYFLPAEDECVRSGADNKRLVSQYIAFMANKGTVYQPTPFVPPLAGKVKREFIPGSGWLYLKIYCTPALADELLVKKIGPAIKKVLKLGAESWFFIRYTDPGPHIRIRVRISEKLTGEVMAIFKAQFSGLVSQQLIREYQADTYRRELERYGADVIGAVEHIFRASSDLIIHYLKNNERAGYSVDHFAISSFGVMLDGVITALEEQLRFLERVSSAFYAEFQGDKNFRVDLDKLYRAQMQEFSAAVNDRQFYHRLGLEKEKNKLVQAIAALQVEGQRKHDLLADLIHMHLNRTYRDQQRRQEMVLYYFLYKYKLSELALSKRSAAGMTLALEEPFLHGS